MNSFRQLKLAPLAFLLAGTLAAGAANAGAEHFEWPIVVQDYNDCTDEAVEWVATVNETFFTNTTPSGQGHVMDHWVFEGTVEGLSTGYLWHTKGIVQVSDNYSLENSLTSISGSIENGLLKPMTEGAPRVRLDVDFKMAYNANGELVVDRFNYLYHCVGNN